MTSAAPVILACFVHMVLHTTLFIHLDPGMFADTSILGSQIFYLSLMDLLCNREVIPTHWSKIPHWGKFILETIIAFLIGEMSMVGLWLPMETLLVNFINFLTNWSGLGYRITNIFLEISTIILGTIFSVIVTVITNRPAKVQKIGERIWRKTTDQSRPFVHQESFSF
ncbi:uncharacterized protein Dere_GG26970 [Drosophila erecta]|uniref:Uncharacterized protein n=1 Tax=Drosophila erecta TaxID=7220 RepID=A0A0Q5VJT3_DROER|nr:uncharacterized protein Dere_GG26970 [Drosophila erecta]